MLSSLNDNEQKQPKSRRPKKSVEKSQGEQNQHDLKELDLAEIRRIQYAVQKVISYHILSFLIIQVSLRKQSGKINSNVSK